MARCFPAEAIQVFHHQYRSWRDLPGFSGTDERPQGALASMPAMEGTQPPIHYRIGICDQAMAVTEAHKGVSLAV